MMTARKQQSKDPSDRPPKLSPSGRSVAGNTAFSLNQAQSSSVPSTPQQRARQFSFESRNPSPTTVNNHSPRSAYSETNSNLPSLRPLPSRFGNCKYETAKINSRRRVPYSVGNERLERIDLRKVKNKMSEAQESSLTSSILEIFRSLLPTEVVAAKRRKLVQKLEKIFNEEWPGHDIRAHLFGSSGNLLCSDDSDVDICITTSWHELEGVCIIADLLARRGMEKVVCISAAKVPIVKIWDPELSLACDMNVNNTLALENTRMVRIYVELDPRVRQLAMIIKYWTRRRIVNDAAFGGTLSSYTWICLIISFLQLREPPVLPALHQLPYKTLRSDGTISEFADDIEKLRGYGSANHSSVSELLFQFFRFLAHEFDYDENVLSVRWGRLVTKEEKKWNYQINNQLCVEEPFNTTRNLGNTVDDYSFRGLHLELRRAFDLISDGRLEEACQQFVYPSIEERIWARPPQQSRPVLVRSSSQTHSNRGGRGSHQRGRHNNFQRGSSNQSRRASSSIPADERLPFAMPFALQQDLAWYQTPQFAYRYSHQDLLAQMAYQQASMRHLQMFAQSPSYVQSQVLGQHLLPTLASAGHQTLSRSRTNSFDNIPSATLVHRDLIPYYDLNLGHTFYQPSESDFTMNQSNADDSASSAQDLRRSFHRTHTPNSNVSMPHSSLRLQSQPAPRSPSSAQQQTASLQLEASVLSNDAPRTFGDEDPIIIPNFLSDEADSELSAGSRADLVLRDGGSAHIPLPVPTFGACSQDSRPYANKKSGIAFGDISSGSSSSQRQEYRPLSEKQLVLGKMPKVKQRGEPSLSSTNHTSSAVITSAPPLVVNGSNVWSNAFSSKRPVQDEDSSSSKQSFTVGRDCSRPEITSRFVDTAQFESSDSNFFERVIPDPPTSISNDSNFSTNFAMEDLPFRERMALMKGDYIPSGAQQKLHIGSVAAFPSVTRKRFVSDQVQHGIIGPLDLAVGESRLSMPSMSESPRLPPVYEVRTPSPNAPRKHGDARRLQSLGQGSHAKAQENQVRTEGTSSFKTSLKGRPTPLTGISGCREDQEAEPQAEGKACYQNHLFGVHQAHNRAKSENESSWHKASKGKRRESVGLHAPAEHMACLADERKGG